MKQAKMLDVLRLKICPPILLIVKTFIRSIRPEVDGAICKADSAALEQCFVCDKRMKKYPIIVLACLRQKLIRHRNNTVPRKLRYSTEPVW
jgi:hypothetical protein